MKRNNHAGSVTVRGGILALMVLSIVIMKCAALKKEPAAPAAVMSKMPGAEPVGSSTCAGCHDDVFTALKESKGIHRTIIDSDLGEKYCESCHGSGGTHADSMDRADIFNKDDIRKLSNTDRTLACMTCHRSLKTDWSQSPHRGGDVSCWDCHGDALHGAPEKFGIETRPAALAGETGNMDFCVQCHEEPSMQFALQYHHPVPEGGMDCTSCHAVHGEAGKLETSVNMSDLCFSCHGDVEGPYVFEHEALAEGCIVCHEPHGSISRSLIEMENNTLCLQCHFQVSFPTLSGMNHDTFVGAGATCWQCHRDVHGSNSSPSLIPGG